MGHTVVMGRLTWESLPAKVRPLPGRRNVVVTRQADYMADGATVVGGLDEALTDDETWVIGGEQIYALALPAGDAMRGHRGGGRPAAARTVTPWHRCSTSRGWAPTGDWLTSVPGLRYRFSSYQPGHEQRSPRAGPPGRASRRRASPSRSRAGRSPARICGG